MTRADGPRASVIVLNYNGETRIGPCLDGVLAQELDGGFEVLVVDNASTDGSARLVRRSYPQVRLVASSRNLGFAAGNNLGLRLAAGRHLVLLNNDAVPRAGWLEALVAAAEADPRVGAVTSKLLFAGARGVIQNAGGVLLEDGGGADRGSGQADRGQFDAAEEVFGFCGAAALLKREALADAGEFDESFFMYYEDTDLSWRMRLRGWRVWYEPRAVVDHEHAATSGEWSPLFAFLVDRNRLLMLLKNAPWRRVLRAYAALLLRSGPGGGGASNPRPPGTRRRVLASYLRLLPRTLLTRRRVRGRRTEPDASIEAWLTAREAVARR